MNLIRLIIFGTLALLIAYALITSPFDIMASFNPVEWLASSVKGFFEWFFGLFLGWMF